MTWYLRVGVTNLARFKCKKIIKRVLGTLQLLLHHISGGRFLLSATLFLAVVSFVIFLRFFCDRCPIAKDSVPPPACHFLASRFPLLLLIQFWIFKFRIMVVPTSNYDVANRFSLPSFSQRGGPIPHKFVPPHQFMMPHHGSHPALPTLSTEHCTNAQ